jgi:hypothetical protein
MIRTTGTSKHPSGGYVINVTATSLEDVAAFASMAVSNGYSKGWECRVQVPNIFSFYGSTEGKDVTIYVELWNREACEMYGRTFQEEPIPLEACPEEA